MSEIRKNANKRRRKRNRVHTLTQVYKCFCKKQYLSYPALYLHVRIKHEHRLTAKDQATKIRLVNQQTQQPKKITKVYQLQMLENNRIKRKLKSKNRFKSRFRAERNTNEDQFIQPIQPKTISEVIQQYCNQLQRTRENLDFENISLLFYLIKACINQNYKEIDKRIMRKIQNYCNQCDAKVLPLSFNFLVSHFIPEFCAINTSNLQKNCLLFNYVKLNEQIKFFHAWLGNKNYSQFKVQRFNGELMP